MLLLLFLDEIEVAETPAEVTPRWGWHPQTISGEWGPGLYSGGTAWNAQSKSGAWGAGNSGGTAWRKQSISGSWTPRP